MSRLSSQGSVIMISDDIEANQWSIVSATKAKPCVVTLVAGTAPQAGEIVVPHGTGWPSIDDMPFKVSNVAGQALTLEDSDTTKEAAAINAVDGLVFGPTWLELCRSNFNANTPAGATIDVTTLCDVAHRIVPGLPAIGTWTAAGFYDCQDAALDRARDCYRSGEEPVIDVRLPDGCGWTFMAIVNTFDVSLGINAAVANNIGGQIDGQVHFYKTPPPGFVPRTLGLRRAPPRAAAPARAPDAQAAA